MKKFTALLLVFILMLSLAACGGTAQKSEESQSQEPAAEEPAAEEPAAEEPAEGEETHSIAYLTVSLGDMGFLDNTWDGIQALAEERGYTAQAIELGLDASVYEGGVLEALDSEKYDVFVAVATGGLDDLIAKYAPEYPEYKFILVDMGRDYETPSDNMVALSYCQNEGSYSAGVLAAALSKSGKVGIYMHLDAPVLNDFATGFYQGASDYNPDIKIYSAYGIGQNGDSPRAAELTKIMFNNGADVVFGVAGSSNPGLFQNVIDLGGFDAGYYAIGVDYDQYQTYINSDSPEMAEVIISSVLKNAGKSIEVIWEKLESGEVSWGDTVLFGLAEESVGLAKNEYYKANVPADIQAKVDEFEAKVANGETKVKSYYDFANHEEFLAYQAQFAA